MWCRWGRPGARSFEPGELWFGCKKFGLGVVRCGAVRAGRVRAEGDPVYCCSGRTNAGQTQSNRIEIQIESNVVPLKSGRAWSGVVPLRQSAGVGARVESGVVLFESGGFCVGAVRWDWGSCLGRTCGRVCGSILLGGWVGGVWVVWPLLWVGVGLGGGATSWGWGWFSVWCCWVGFKFRCLVIGLRFSCVSSLPSCRPLRVVHVVVRGPRPAPSTSLLMCNTLNRHVNFEW